MIVEAYIFKLLYESEAIKTMWTKWVTILLQPKRYFQRDAEPSVRAAIRFALIVLYATIVISNLIRLLNRGEEWQARAVIHATYDLASWPFDLLAIFPSLFKATHIYQFADSMPEWFINHFPGLVEDTALTPVFSWQMIWVGPVVLLTLCAVSLLVHLAAKLMRGRGRFGETFWVVAYATAPLPLCFLWPLPPGLYLPFLVCVTVVCLATVILIRGLQQRHGFGEIRSLAIATPCLGLIFGISFLAFLAPFNPRSFTPWVRAELEVTGSGFTRPEYLNLSFFGKDPRYFGTMDLGSPRVPRDRFYLHSSNGLAMRSGQRTGKIGELTITLPDSIVSRRERPLIFSADQGEFEISYKESVYEDGVEIVTFSASAPQQATLTLRRFAVLRIKKYGRERELFRMFDGEVHATFSDDVTDDSGRTTRIIRQLDGPFRLRWILQSGSSG